jgi:hypothetical protein
MAQADSIALPCINVSKQFGSPRLVHMDVRWVLDPPTAAASVANQ